MADKPAPDKLAKYHKKRDFSKTAEPAGAAAVESGPQPVFVIQKHAASRLHYDVRFEVEGVMPSWAVPKGPSYNPADKRLAVQTEDHPLDYRTFEGNIPHGEYGGGAVIIWDEGTYENLSEKNGKAIDMRDAIEKGHFTVIFHGHKLQGAWAFTRTNDSNWIMVKRKDDDADPALDITETRPESVKTQQTIEQVAADEQADTWTRAMATFVPPMLAELKDTPLEGDDWILERKLDGLRCVVVRNGDDVQLWSRNHLSFNRRFPELIDAVRNLPVDNIVLDGELVAFDDRDRTSFSLLQRGESPGAPQLYFFDLIHLLGQDVRHLPLVQRQELLRKMSIDTDLLKTVQQEVGTASDLLEHTCQNGWEGLIAKRPDSIYVSGRSSAWRKLKCLASQELVIGGWTEPKGARVGFGALLVGYFEDGEFRYAGKVGTGFDMKLLKSLHADLKAREQTSSPFVEVVKEKTVHWAKPELVANIGFSEWTSDGRLRHPRFEGLRPDKNAAEVVRERH